MEEFIEDPSNNSKCQTQYTIQEIQELLPHRYPFSLVDRILIIFLLKKQLELKM